MKKNLRNIISISLVVLLIFSSCSKKEEIDIEDKKLDLPQIDNIVELSTIEVYFNNVAKNEKKAGTGIFNIGEKDRKFWIEYEGTAKIVIDVSKVKIDYDNNVINIFIPKAEILGKVKINEDSLTEDSFVISSDGLNKNKISVENQREAIELTQDEMTKEILANKKLLISAQLRAKLLIENYINQINDIENPYIIEWELEKIE